MKFLPILYSMAENTYPQHIRRELILAIAQKGTILLLAYKIHLHAQHQMLATSNGEEVRE